MWRHLAAFTDLEKSTIISVNYLSYLAQIGCIGIFLVGNGRNPAETGLNKQTNKKEFIGECNGKAPGVWPQSQLDPGDPMTGRNWLLLSYLGLHFRSFLQVAMEMVIFISYPLKNSCGKTAFLSQWCDPKSYGLGSPSHSMRSFVSLWLNQWARGRGFLIGQVWDTCPPLESISRVRSTWPVGQSLGEWLKTNPEAVTQMEGT